MIEASQNQLVQLIDIDFGGVLSSAGPIQWVLGAEILSEVRMMNARGIILSQRSMENGNGIRIIHLIYQSFEPEQNNLMNDD